jgi:exopolysaccharide production protein ExoY
VNVILGDMSLVGPRPIVPSETWRYGRRIRQYCSVRPGLTGLWQISGRSDTGYRSRVAMDVVYARSKRVWLDLRIIAATIPVVLMGRGSY